MHRKSQVQKIFALLLCLLLCFEQSGFAQILPTPVIQDVFRPLHLRYLSYDTLNNNFRLLLDKGSLKNPKPEEITHTTKQLLNYFSVGLTLPSESFWVNLRPDGESNIIDSELVRTDMGRVMLEADLQLKKDTANSTSPNTPEGKKYWDRLYKKAEELFGSQNATIPTLTRVWIVPDEIILSETQTSAYIYKATLKVLLEQDYLKDSTLYNFSNAKEKALNEYSSQLFRESIIPKLTKEVNASKRYAPLRQVYYSLIMAEWFKARFSDKKGLSPKGTVPDLINSKNLTGLTSKEPWSKTTYFKAYQKSAKEGEYNIQETVNVPFSAFHQITKQYICGGVLFGLGTTETVETARGLKFATFKSLMRPPGNVGYNGTTTTYLQAANSMPSAETVKNAISVEVDVTDNRGELRQVQIVENTASSVFALPIAGDVNLAAGKIRRVPHGGVNSFIRDNLPQDLRNNAGNINNYRLVNGYDTQARVIPIEGLFQATGQFAHIGLGQVYGQAVIYIDSMLNEQETKDVLSHELFEIDKWETLRKRIGLKSYQMRQWIQNNYQTAKTLDETYHNQAPSVAYLFDKYRSQVDQDSIERLFAMYGGTKDINLAAEEKEEPARNIDKLFAEVAKSTAELNQLGWVDDDHVRHVKRRQKERKRELLAMSPDQLEYYRRFGLISADDEKILATSGVIDGEVGILTPSLPGTEEQTTTLPVSRQQLASEGRTTAQAQNEIREQIQDIMFTKMHRVIDDIFYGRRDLGLSQVDPVELVSNTALLKRYHHEVQLRIQRGGEMLLEGIPGMPSRLRTEEDIRKFFNWFLGILGEVGFPVMGNRKTSISEKAFLDAMAEAKASRPEEFTYAEDYLKKIGFTSYDQALASLGPKQLLAYLTIGEIRWEGIVTGRAREKTLSDPQKYPLERTELQTVVIGRERRLKIEAHLKSIYNRILLDIGALSEKFNPAYAPTLDVIILAPDYYEGDGGVAHDANAARESYVNNPLYTIRVALHELRHRQLAIESGTISESAYHAEEDIERLEEGRINLETEVIFKKVADYLGSTETLDVVGFHLYADAMATPLDPSRSFQENERFVLSEYYLQSMSVMFYEWFIKGKEKLFALKGHELLNRFYAEIISEIEGQSHSVVRDDILRQGARDYDRTRVVTTVEGAFENLFRSKSRQELLRLPPGVQAPTSDWALDNARSGYMMDRNLANLSIAIFGLYERRFELSYSLSMERREQAMVILRYAFKLLMHRESGMHIFEILSCVRGEEARKFIESELAATTPNEFAYGFVSSGELIKYLGVLGAKESMSIIMSRLKDANSDLGDIIYSVFDILGEESIDFLEGVLTTSILSEETKRYDSFVEQGRMAAAGLLAKLHNRDHAPAILNRFRKDSNKKVRGAVLHAIAAIEERQRYGEFEVRSDKFTVRPALKQREVREVEAILKGAAQSFQDYTYLSFPLYQSTLLISDNRTGQILGVAMFWIEDEIATLGKLAFSQTVSDTVEVEKQLFENSISFLKRKGIKIIDNSVSNQPELFAERMGFKNYGNSSWLIIDEQSRGRLQPWVAKPLLMLRADEKQVKTGALPRSSEELRTAREVARQIDSQRQAYGTSTLKKPYDDAQGYSSEDENLSMRDQRILAQHFERGDRILQLFGDFRLKRLATYTLPILGATGRYYFFSYYQPENSLVDERLSGLLEQDNFDFRTQKPIRFPDDMGDESLDVIVCGYNEESVPGGERHVEEMLYEIDRALKRGGTIIFKADGKGFAELDYYGKDIFSERYERITIDGLLNPHEWVILKKKTSSIGQLTMGQSETVSLGQIQTTNTEKASSSVEGVGLPKDKIQYRARDNRIGGIDFRNLPLVRKAIGNLKPNIGSSAMDRLKGMNLEAEWRDIENSVNSGVIPQAERLKEYIQASCLKGNADKDMDKVISCIADILRIEEERYVSTEPLLQYILIAIESANSIQQLRAVFIGTAS